MNIEGKQKPPTVEMADKAKAIQQELDAIYSKGERLRSEKDTIASGPLAEQSREDYFKEMKQKIEAVKTE